MAIVPVLALGLIGCVSGGGLATSDPQFQQESVWSDSMKTEALLEAYRQAAIRHRTALEEGNAKAANRAHDKVVKLSHHFRHGASDLREAFMVLLNDEDLSVRAWAATHALEFIPDEAIRVLRKIARGPRSLIRLSAEMVLAQWEAGTLYLP